MDKNDIYLRGASKQSALFRKSVLKNGLILPMSRIGPGLKSDSQFQKYLGGLLHGKPFKNDEECFLFQLKSPFCSQDILSFYHDFLVI